MSRVPTSFQVEPVLIDPAVYCPARDGDVYLYWCNRTAAGAIPIFSGPDPIMKLIELGVVIPGITSIRFMYNVCRFDAYYYITETYELEGLNARAHSGEEGVFSLYETLEHPHCPPYEIHELVDAPITKSAADDEFWVQETKKNIEHARIHYVRLIVQSILTINRTK